MIIDLSELVEREITDLKEELEKLPPNRVLFAVFEESSAGRSFLERKTKIALRLGVQSEVRRVEASSELEANNFVQNQLQYDGVVIQLPLPKNIGIEEVLNAVPLDKDIDMLSAAAKEQFAKGQTRRMPPVARAVQLILEERQIDLADKNILVLGGGRLVGKPVASIFLKLEAKFSTADARTEEGAKLNLIKEADIIVTGIGRPGYIRPEMIKEGVFIIDAGTSESAGRVVGDVDPLCISKADVTPVPGGVGALAVVSLFRNLLY